MTTSPDRSDHLDLTALSGLAARPGRDPVPITDIQWRARAIKRRRRGASVTCAAVLGVALIAAPSLWPTAGGPPMQQVAASGTECPPAGFTEAVRPAQARDVLEIAPDPSADLPLHYYFVRQDSPICPLGNPLVIGVEKGADGTLISGMTVWYNLEDQLLEDLRSDPMVSDDVVDVTVRGRPGTVLKLPNEGQPERASSFRLSWRDEGGIPWLVEASGTSVKELVEAVDALRFTGSERQPVLVTDSLPAGLSAVPMPDRPEPDGRWTIARYGDAQPSTHGVALNTARLRGPLESRASILASDSVRLVDRKGRTYLVERSEHPGLGVNTSVTWIQDGNTIQLGADAATLSESALLDMAATVGLADPSDPRLFTDHTGITPSPDK